MCFNYFKPSKLVGLKEKDYNLLIGERVINYLKNYDVKVVTTRESDEFISLEKRVDISNKNKCDLFISIHCNAHTNNESNGFETYTYTGNSDLQKLTHKNILNKALDSLKSKLMKSNIASLFLPDKFTFPQLQAVYETILQCKFDRRNFRRKFLSLGIIRLTGEKEEVSGHRPGLYYEFINEGYKELEVFSFDKGR